MKKLFLSLNVFVFLCFSVLAPFAFAQQTNLDCDPSAGGFCNPAGSEKNWTAQGLTAKIIKIVLGLVGVVALILFIYAGFMWMTAQGKSDQIKKARDTMVWAVLGLIVVFSSYVIVSFVLKEMPL